MLWSNGAQTFWHQGLVSWKTVSLQTGEMVDGFRGIQVHYIYCALYYYISSTSRSSGIRSWRLGALGISQSLPLLFPI